MEQFEATLSAKDKTILDLRMKGRTLQEIAGIVDYETPSAVKKRIGRIADQYETFINPLPERAERPRPEKRFQPKLRKMKLSLERLQIKRLKQQ